MADAAKPIELKTIIYKVGDDTKILQLDGSITPGTNTLYDAENPAADAIKYEGGAKKMKSYKGGKMRKSKKSRKSRKTRAKK